MNRDLVTALRPPAASVAIREITADGNDAANVALFGFCRAAAIDVQFILCDQGDIDQLAALVGHGVIPLQDFAALIVLGRYSTGQIVAPEDVAPMADRLLGAFPDIDWAACAFGARETACLLKAHRMGGKCRVGFENNRLNADGREARDNGDRIAELSKALEGMDER